MIVVRIVQFVKIVQLVQLDYYGYIKFFGAFVGIWVGVFTLEDSHCSISNNMSENSIRPITVRRKNWLFCDTTDDADASMMVFSLLETARANGINPYKYLEFLLESRPNEKMTDEQLDSLSPWNENVKQICQNNS